MLFSHKSSIILLQCICVVYCHVPYSVEQLNSDVPYPIVMWHGVGDTCCNGFMNTFKKFLEQNIPNVTVVSLRIGNTTYEDSRNAYFMNVNEQVSMVCDMLSSNEILENGYNAIGFSQGAQFLRGAIQRCSGPPVINFISLGGQHQGVFGFPHCPKKIELLCYFARGYLSPIIYSKIIQNRFVQAQFWHDPVLEDMYKQRSTYLSDINNELFVNETYKQNLMKLKNLVLVKFARDTIVVPKESEWFGYYKPGQANVTYALQESKLYIEDRLGLRELDTSKRLHFLTMDRDHMHIDWTWILENIINPFLSPNYYSY